MRRVWMTGGAIAVGDGVLLGTSAAFGWTAVTILAVLIGVAGALKVALATPPPRPVARPATITLGVPMREPVEDAAPAEVDPPRTIVTPAPEVGAAPVAA